jgi:hypothetical protein
MSRALLLALAAAFAFAGCQDPVHENEVAALGNEAPGVSPGPTHRPGQPCLVCHGGEGPGNPQFAIAGTVYQVPTATIGMNGATVKATDVNKSSASATTNSVGNFYIAASDYSPTYPVDVEIDDGQVQTKMLTHIGRDGACASCHFDPPGPTTPGHVYLVGDVADLPGAGGGQ